MHPYVIDWIGFLKALRKQTTQSEAEGSIFALVIIQLRQFPLYNYRMGFAGGEKVMKELMAKVSGSLKKVSVVTRIAPDRIGVIVANVEYPELLPLALERLSNDIEDSSATNDSETIDASIGFALFPHHGRSGERLMSEAELALAITRGQRKPAKEISRKTFSDKQLDQLQIERDLRMAISNGNLVLNYQPKIDIHTMKPKASEALMRWVKEDGERISPGQFIKVAEASGDIHALTDWAINTALREAADLLKSGITLGVSVNISAPSLYDPLFVNDIERALAIWGLPADQFTLEITETVLMKNTEISFLHLSQIRKLGVKISIDDFGTGFSSLAYFKTIPADEIKIDQSFIFPVCDSVADEHIVSSIIDLGHKFGLEVVAEGIENERILNKLREMGCDIGQGFYLAKPMDFEDYHCWLDNTERL